MQHRVKEPTEQAASSIAASFHTVVTEHKPNTNQKELAGSAPAESQHKDSIPFLILAISSCPLQPHLIGPAWS